MEETPHAYRGGPYWLLAAGSLGKLVEHAWTVLGFLGLVALFPPVTLPQLPVVLPWRYPWISFASWEVAFLVVLFSVTTFFMPSAFVQVALAGSYQAAYRAPAVLTFPLRHARLYLEAWVISLAAARAQCSRAPSPRGASPGRISSFFTCSMTH